jgi:hypothetical protein
VESATIKIPSPRRNANVRAYLAGGGATAALVAAAVIVFIGAAAFVGFNGLPFGADDAPDSTVNLATGVPEAAAAAAGPTADAVAGDPATPSPAAIDEILAALPPGATIPGIIPTIDGGGNPGAGPGTGTPPTPASSGAVGNTVGGVEDTAGDLGLNLPLGGLTEDVTGPVDQAANNAVNGVGGALGDDKLGDKVTGSVNEATNGVLGPGGLTDSLLGGK